MSTGVAMTRLSSKGKVEIPEEIRNSLGLKDGVQFLVIGRGDAVILQKISEPSMEEFEELMHEAEMKKAEMKKAEMKKADVKKADVKKADVKKADVKKADVKKRS